MELYCDETCSKISVSLIKQKQKKNCGTLKLLFLVSTKKIFLDVINWPRDFSYFIYDNATKGKYPDDFIEMKIYHMQSGVNNVFTSDQLIERENFDSYFRDTFYKTGNIAGNIFVTITMFRDSCKYCICKNK